MYGRDGPPAQPALVATATPAAKATTVRDSLAQLSHMG